MVNAIYYSHHAADPIFNMAFDEWMLRRVLIDPSAILLRLYSWKPGAITVGFNQQVQRALVTEQLGHTPVIRRVTGGRAIYHDESELTYSIAFCLGGGGVPWSGDAADAYMAFAEMLTEFLGRCGRVTEIVRQSSRENARPEFFHTAPCFASRARYELMAGHRKLLASAQRRIEDGVLQHGSIKVNGLVNHPAMPQIDGGSTDTKKAVTPEDFEEFSSQFISACAGRLQLRVKSGGADWSSPDLVTRIDSVRKNPLAKRDDVKQSGVTVSL
jgi:lipoate-protein ligase A